MERARGARDAARRLESPNLSLSFLVEITPKLEGDQAAPTVARITPIITNESPTPGRVHRWINIYIDNKAWRYADQVA